MEGKPLAAQSPVLVGTSAAVRALDAELTQLAGDNGPVLIVGERGSGRVDAARELHLRSERASYPFVIAKMSRVQTGLDSLARAAYRGTLCLENARALGSWERTQIAEIIERNVTRVVASTADEHDDVFSQRFTVLRVPALSARREDFSAVVHHLFEAARLQIRNARATSIQPELLERLALRRWPGNVSELEATIEAMLRHSPGPELVPRDLDRITWLADVTTLDKLDDVIWLHIRSVLTRTDGNKTHAAKLLGVDPATLHRWIRRKQ